MASQNTPFKSGSTTTQRKQCSRPINGNGNGNGIKQGSSIYLPRQATESDYYSSKFSRVNEQYKIQPIFGAKVLDTTKSVDADKVDNAKNGDGDGAKRSSITTWSPLSDGIVTICSSQIPNIDVPKIHEELVKSIDDCIDNALYDVNRKAKHRLPAFKDFCPE